MKSIKKLPGLLITMLLLCMSLTVSAFAAEAPAFRDVSSDSPWYEGVAYAAEQGITSGTGNGCYSPNQKITARQWAVMLCNAYDKDVEPAEDQAFGAAELKLAYKEGWLDLSAMVKPDSAMCRRYTYESIFRVERIPVFSSVLYDTDGSGSLNRCVTVAKENQLCAPDASERDLITRGEAAQIIYMMQTQDIKVEMPKLLQKINLVNTDQITNLKSYLLELNKIPESILYEFNADGWSYCLDSEYVDDVGDQLGMECAGCCNYAKKKIFVKLDYATIHEFGHYYHSIINSASDFKVIFEKEAEASEGVLGDYATTNDREYFAETFAYWINWSHSQSKMEALEETAPETYEFFRVLALNNWSRTK